MTIALKNVLASGRYSFFHGSVAKYSSTSGGALIIVLIFSMLIALLFVSIMESSILQLKMVSNFQLMKKTQQEAEDQLILFEESLKNYSYQNVPEHTSFIQFVPDTLSFGETQGTDYYRIKVENEQESGAYYQIVTTYGVRHESAHDVK